MDVLVYVTILKRIKYIDFIYMHGGNWEISVQQDNVGFYVLLIVRFMAINSECWLHPINIK